MSSGLYFSVIKWSQFNANGETSTNMPTYNETVSACLIPQNVIKLPTSSVISLVCTLYAVFQKHRKLIWNCDVGLNVAV